MSGFLVHLRRSNEPHSSDHNPSTGCIFCDRFGAWDNKGATHRSTRCVHRMTVLTASQLYRSALKGRPLETIAIQIDSLGGESKVFDGLKCRVAVSRLGRTASALYRLPQIVVFSLLFQPSFPPFLLAFLSTLHRSPRCWF
jgi:hypothetical protein